MNYMDETVLQKNQKKDPTPVQVTQGAKRKPRRSGLMLLLFAVLIILAALAVYGVLNRSTTTEKLQQQATQAASEQTVTVVKPERLPTTPVQLLPI